jgi:vitamin B12 transporter
MVAKGFKGRYFSLAAITATVSLVMLGAKAVQAKEIQKVVVSANKKVQLLDEVTDDVEVISSEEIRERGYTTLAELLKEVGSLDVVQAGGFGQTLSLYLQGLSPDKTLILIDGIRFNDPTGLSGGMLELISLDNIERVEIIKGAQSGVWGADAVAGVINIVTKQARGDISGGWKIEGGSYNTINGAMSLFKQGENYSYGLGVKHFYTKGFSAYGAKKTEPLYGVKASDLPLEDDGFDNKEIDFKTRYNFNDIWIGLNLIKIYSTIHYDNYGSDALDSPFTINKVNDTLYKIDLSKEVSGNKLLAEYKYSKFKRSQWGGYEGDVKELELKDSFNIFGANLQIGGGYQRFYQKKSAGVETNSGYQNHYVFATFSKKIDRFLVNGALRYDSYNKFEDKLTYKIGIKSYLTQKIYIASNLATGYKAPSIFQLNYNATKNLDTEKSLSYNLILGGDFFKVSLFENKVEDLITYTDPDWDYTTPNDYYYNASGESKFKGMEVSLFKDFFDEVFAKVTYTYLDAKDSEDKSIPQRAKNKVSYSFSWYPELDFTLNINGYYVGSKEDYDGTQTGKYNVTNLVLNYDILPNLRGFLKVNNLFDRFYQEIHGYTTADRSYYVGIEAVY